MDRRQVLHALNAIGICAALPTSAYCDEGFSVNTQRGMPPVTEDRAASDAAEAAWSFPKIGIVSVGAGGRSCLLGPIHVT